MKTIRSNLDGSLSACLQSNEALEKVKQTDGHPSKNILTMRHDIVEGRMTKLLAKKIGNIPSPISTETTPFAHVTSTTTQTNKDKVMSANFENVGGSCKPSIKGKCLIAQTNSMVAMTRKLEGSSEAKDNCWWLGTLLAKTKQKMLKSPTLSKQLR